MKFNNILSFPNAIKLLVFISNVKIFLIIYMLSVKFEDLKNIHAKVTHKYVNVFFIKLGKMFLKLYFNCNLL